MTSSILMARLSSLYAISSVLWVSVAGFNMGDSNNLAIYWGQNSYGAAHGNDPANWQRQLAHYCGSDSVVDAIPVAFVTSFFDEGGLPSMDLSNMCSASGGQVFPGTHLPNCDFLAADIEACQAAGKIVTISLGGGTGAVGFSSDAQAVTFARTIWDLFLGGSSTTRPFGKAVLDGVDLDIEGGTNAGYAAFVDEIRSLASGASKQYYVTAAPQCPYPDYYLGAALNAASFDAVYVQFYNNYCGLTSYDNPNNWNFGTWDNWAKTISPNKDVKIYIGAPADATAAGSGYVDSDTLAKIISETQSKYSSFGGVMLWDLSQAYANDRFDVAVKNALNAEPSPTTSVTTKTSTTTGTSSVPTGGICAGISAWSSSIAYVGGSQVTYDGRLWTAKWWTQGDIPGGSVDVWTNDGACSSSAVIYTVPAASVTPIQPTPTAGFAAVAQKAFYAPEAQVTIA